MSFIDEEVSRETESLCSQGSVAGKPQAKEEDDVDSGESQEDDDTYEELVE